jgi:nucleoside-diphosphate-sugar epimerase
MSRYLVTGAFGAIGVWAIRALLDRGHEVISFDIGEQAPRLPLALTPEQIDAITRVRGDIADLNAVERALDEHGVTHVIHLAALQVPFVRADPPLGARVDVLGTVNVFEAVRRRRDRIAPLVYASSIAALGEGEHPSTLYGVFKWANEGTGQRYFEDYRVSSIGIRPHTVYGPARDQGLTSAPTTALLAAAFVRWRHRLYFAVLALVGLAIAVGTHPYDDPSPVGAFLKAFADRSTAGLALRSVGRAVPLVALGIAVLIFLWAVDAFITTWFRPQWVPVARGFSSLAVIGVCLGVLARLWRRRSS